MRRKKSGFTMNAEFPNQREHSARKTHSINTRFVSPMQQRKESEGKGSTVLEQSLRPLIYGFNTAPLWFLEPRSGVAARAPEVLVVGLWCWRLWPLWSLVAHVAAALRAGPTAERAWRQNSLGHLEVTLGKPLMGAGTAAGSAGRTFWWEFSQC